MKKILIVKTGSMPFGVSSIYGDMENYFINAMGLPETYFETIEVFNGEELPDAARFAGVLVTGSNLMVTSWKMWMQKTSDWLKSTVDKNIPTLGVCFGHQLLGAALGGRIDNNPNGREIGTVTVKLADKAGNDELMGVFSQPEITVQVSHSQSVVELPENVEIMAYNRHDPHHVFKVKNKYAWGFQFHPEFTADIVRKLLDLRRKQIRDEGLDVDILINSCADAGAGGILLRRFAKLIAEQES